MMITATEASCDSHAVPYMDFDDRARMRTLVRARKALARSQRSCTTCSAACDLIVSMPDRLSIRVAWRSAAAW